MDHPNGSVEFEMITRIPLSVLRKVAIDGMFVLVFLVSFGLPSVLMVAWGSLSLYPFLGAIVCTVLIQELVLKRVFRIYHKKRYPYFKSGMLSLHFDGMELHSANPLSYRWEDLQRLYYLSDIPSNKYHSKGFPPYSYKLIVEDLNGIQTEIRVLGVPCKNNLFTLKTEELEIVLEHLRHHKHAIYKRIRCGE